MQSGKDPVTGLLVTGLPVQSAHLQAASPREGMSVRLSISQALQLLSSAQSLAQRFITVPDSSVFCIGGEVIPASKVVLAVGHSSRAMYRTLAASGVTLSPKPFALGLRVEHPQALIDTIQYGQEYAAG